MPPPDASQITALDLGRLTSRDIALLGEIRGRTAGFDALLSKVDRVFTYWTKRPSPDDYELAVLGQELNSALSADVWAILVYALEQKFGLDQVGLFTQRITSKEHPSKPLKLALLEADTDPKRTLGDLIKSIWNEDSIAHLSYDILKAIKQLGSQVDRTITEDSFIGNLVNLLAATNARGDLRKRGRASELETAARVEILQTAAREIIRREPDNEKAWSFLGRAFEREMAWAEAELVYLYLIQRFDSESSWDSLLILLGRMEGRAEDSWIIGEQALIRYPDTFGILSSTLRAGLRTGVFRERFSRLSDLSLRLLFSSTSQKNQESIPARMFANIHIKALEQELPIDDALKAGAEKILALYPDPQELTFYARNFAAGAKFLKVLLERFKKDHSDQWSADIEDVFNSSLAFGDTEDLRTAIDAGYSAILGDRDMASTRRWLAQALIKDRGFKEGKAEAERLLREGSDKFNDDRSLEILYLVKEKKEEFLDDISSKGRLIDPEKIRGVGREHSATTFYKNSDFQRSIYTLDDDIREVGELKRAELRKLLELESLPVLKSEKGRIQWEILQARYTEIESKPTLGPLAAQFERALRIGDIALLKRIQEMIPQLTALTLVTRSMFGDADASAALLRFFENESSLRMTDQLLIQRLKQKIRHYGKGTDMASFNLSDALARNRADIVVFLRDANDAHALRAAA